jgi:hypothetical protein
LPADWQRERPAVYKTQEDWDRSAVAENVLWTLPQSSVWTWLPAHFPGGVNVKQFVVTVASVTGLAVMMSAAPARAQDTREEELAAERADKATSLHPYEPNGLERRIKLVDNLLFPQGPLYPFIGSVFEGGGLAGGGGFRRRVADSGSFNAHAAWSVRNYGDADASLLLPALPGGRVTVAMHGEKLHAPTVPFYGLGNGSPLEGRGEFAYNTTTAGVSTRVQAARALAVGGGLDRIGIRTNPTGIANVTRLDPTYRRSSVFAEVDWRTSPGYTQSGGFYRLDWSDYRETNSGANSFRRLDAEVQQLVPLLRENQVIAVRGLASTTSADAGETVPYFMMPELGGSQVLRGYSSWRFRDRDRLLLTGEYRWTAGPLVDMLLFFDAGKVAARTADLNLRDLKTSQGIGLSLHTPITTPMRIQVAHSREGVSLVFSFSPSF